MMKLTINTFLFFIFLFSSLTALCYEKPRVAVLDLKAEGVAMTDSSAISGFLITDLSNSDILTVLDRSNVEQILREQQFQRSGCTSQDCVVEIGKILNVNKMISGTVGKFAGEYYIQINFTDVQTSAVDFAENVKFSVLADAQDSCSTLASKILDQIKSKVLFDSNTSEPTSQGNTNKTGTLQIKTKLSGVNITIDSEDYGIVTDGLKSVDLKCGSHQIIATKDDNYFEYNKDVIVYSGTETEPLNIALQRKKGNIRINTGASPHLQTPT